MNAQGDQAGGDQGDGEALKGLGALAELQALPDDGKQDDGQQ